MPKSRPPGPHRDDPAGYTCPCAASGVLAHGVFCLKGSVKIIHNSGLQFWQKDDCLDSFTKDTGKKAASGSESLPGLVSEGLGRMRNLAQDRTIREPREDVFLSTIPCPEHSRNSQERSQNLCLAGLISTVLLPCIGWNPSVPNGPEAISTIDRWPGCSPVLPE